MPESKQKNYNKKINSLNSKMIQPLLRKFCFKMKDKSQRTKKRKKMTDLNKQLSITFSHFMIETIIMILIFV